MSEPAPAEETTEILAISLTCHDTIVRDPDRAAEIVEWEVTHREWAKDLAPTDRVLLVDYRLPDGTTGRHAFENPVAKVTVRVSGLFGAAA